MSDFREKAIENIEEAESAGCGKVADRHRDWATTYALLAIMEALPTQ